MIKQMPKWEQQATWNEEEDVWVLWQDVLQFYIYVDIF